MLLCLGQEWYSKKKSVTWWRSTSQPLSRWQMPHMWCQAPVSEVNWFICPQLSGEWEAAWEAGLLSVRITFGCVGSGTVEGVVHLVNPFKSSRLSSTQTSLKTTSVLEEHTHRNAVYLILPTLPTPRSSSFTHTHTQKDTQNESRRKLNCACFIIWAVQCFSPSPSSVMV